MDASEVEKYTNDLIYYADQIEAGKDFEINWIEMRLKLDSLNERADKVLENGELDEYKLLCHFAYQYYRLLYL